MIELFPARDDDSIALQRVIALAFAEYPGCIFDLSELPELEHPAMAFAMAGGCLWVAREQAGGRSEVVGCVGLVRDPGEPGLVELKKLYTLARVRGLGLGRRLIEHAEGQALDWGAKAIRLWTDTRFHTAHRVYERLGYIRLPGARQIDDLSHSVEYCYFKTLDERA